MSKKKMKFNEVYVSGEVLDIIDVKKLNKNTEKEAVTFKLKVETGKNESEMVDFYCNKFLNNGSPNQMYIRTIDVANNIKTRAENGTGSLVATTSQLDKNCYVTKAGNVVRNTRIAGTFCNLEKDSKYPIKPNQVFRVYALIKKIEKKEDYLSVIGLVNKYAYVNGSGVKKANGFETEFRVYGDLIDDFNDFYNEGDIALLSGDFKTIVTQTGRGFGNRKSNNYDNYLNIKGGDEPVATVKFDENKVPFLEVLDEHVCGQENFPFTIEYIQLMNEGIEKEEQKLKEKQDEIEAELEREVVANDEDDPFDEDDLPF